jgi:putative PIN family toxin of toxin-antitoxin system
VSEPLRVVLDPGVLVSAIITPQGPTGQLIAAIRAGRVRPVVCPHLVDELAGVLRRPKFRRFLTADESDQAVELLARVAEHHDDPPEVPRRSRDPNDDYLLALVVTSEATALVSGDKDLTTVDADDVTVLTPAALFNLLDADDAPAAASSADTDQSAGT